MNTRKQMLIKHAPVIGVILFSGVSLVLGVSPSFVLVLSTWIFAFMYACYNLRKRVFLAAFLISFFVFLLGAHFVYEYFGMEVQYHLGDSYYINSNLAIFFSLISLTTTFVVIDFLRNKRKCGQVEESQILAVENLNHSQKVETIRIISKILFYISSIFWIGLIVEKGIFVYKNTYLSYYVNFSSSIPVLLRAIGEMSPYFFYIFLATMPSKKETVFPLILYVLYALLSITTGRRIELVIMILFVVLYFIFREKNSFEKYNWITKKMLVFMFIALPIFLILLYSFNYLRFLDKVAPTSLWHKLLSFFRQQGFSSSIIRLTEYHKEELNPNAYYSFFGLLKWLRTNSLIRLFYRPDYGFSYIGPSVEFATLGNSLANSLGYIVLPEAKFMGGTGLGSCYVAELSHDFGSAGVVLGSSIYGLFIALISRLLERPYNRIWAVSICFSVFESFMKAPRWNYDIVFVSLLDLGMWSAIICTLVLSFLYTRWIVYRERHKEKK